MFIDMYTANQTAGGAVSHCVRWHIAVDKRAGTNDTVIPDGRPFSNEYLARYKATIPDSDRGALIPHLASGHRPLHRVVRVNVYPGTNATMIADG
jgi:hypothetical protein